MAQAANTELVEKFEQFYRDYYRDEIGELARGFPTDQRSLYVDWNDLYRFDADLADDYLAQPGQLRQHAEEALRLYDLPVDVKLGGAHVRVRNLPETTEIRDLRSRHVGRLVAVQGLVRKATDVRPKLQHAAFECQRCGSLTPIEQSSTEYEEPHECQGCERQGPFQLNVDQSEFVDSQQLRVQESPEGLRGGETPRSIDVRIEDDLTGEVAPGDHVTVTGILRLDQSGGADQSPVFEMYMDGVTVEIDEEEFEDMEITEADKQEIVELSMAEDLYDRVVDSIAPSIYGYEEEKLAMALQLFSGVTKELPDGSRIRGDLHILLIGDPGTGKCVRGETSVTLANGVTRPIRDVVEDHLVDPVPVDDGVYEAVDFPVPSMASDGSMVERRATKVWKREAPDRMYRIRTATGKELEVTPSHPLFVQSGGGFEAVQADELGEGDFVAAPREVPSEGVDDLDVEYRESRANDAVRLDLPGKWTPSLARLLGYVVAEGYVQHRSDNTGMVWITNEDREILDDIADAFDRLGLNTTERAPHEGKTAREVYCSSVEFVTFLESLEPALLGTSEDQRVPEAMMRASPEIKAEFLRAYVDSDGHVSATEREISVASMSRQLLEDVRSLLLSLGITCRIRERENGSYRLRISGNAFVEYVDAVGFVTDRKTEAANEFTDDGTNTNTDVVPDLGNELGRIRARLGLSLEECGIPGGTYRHYEAGDRNPGRDSLQSVLGAFEERLDRFEELRESVANGDWDAVETARRKLDLSQRELARALGLSQTAISHYGRGETVPDGGTVVAARKTIPDHIDDALEAREEVEALRQSAEAEIGWERIEAVEAVDPDYEWVYDLEVEGTHNYLTNAVVSHNSQLLQYIRQISPRSVYTSGKGSSAAGLTAAAVRDDFGEGQQWSLEAGALVLADRGIAAIDEIDKMTSDDRSAMHEALEQQSYHPETEVLLADGRREEIGDFVDERMTDRREAVVDGVDCEILPVDDVRVHSVDFETNETTKLPVDRVSRHEAPEEFVRVTFSNGRDVLVTPEHPMFVDDDGEVGTVDARDVEEGTFVPAPRQLPNSAAPVELDDEPHRGKEKDVDLPGELTGDLAELLGFLVAEGHSYAGSAHEIGFSNRDERLLARMDRLMTEVFGMESTDTTNAAGTVTKRWISTKLYRWFEENVPEVMHTARDKRIPARVLGASEEHVRRFLVGAFAGDGGVESEATSFSTASEGLAHDYADALSKVGVASRIHHDSAEDSWKVYVMGDSTERFVDRVVESADERYETARAFVERSNDTPRHHDVLPTSAAREIRELRTLLGLRLTGEFRPALDEGYGVQVGTVRSHVRRLRDRIRAVRTALADAGTLAEVRSAAGWSGRELADRLDGETTSAVHYAEDGGYDREQRREMAAKARTAVETALSTAEERIDALEERLTLRYYRVTDVERVPNEGEYATEWVYDVTVEPTNTFVSQGVALHNSISISKAGINATLKSRCALLAAANPKYGRFDQFESIGEQIDLEPALISRFDLIFTVTDQPDEEKDRRLADHILTTNYAGELNTQHQEMTSPDVTREEVESIQEEVDPVIEPDLFRKYVAYAKQNCHPRMTDEARSTIEEFYTDLRAKGTDEDAPVPITARKLEAVIRLAEASARIRLSDEVTQEDADRVIDIVQSSLEKVGVDPESGEFDADFVETSTPKSQRDRIKNIKTLIEELADEYEDGAPKEVITDRAEEHGIDADQVDHEITKLKEKGEIYETQTDHYRVV
ncbi:MCM family protein [Halobacteriales archaeon QS_8_69_26]|nr:MAG: MCM family protein [Halobacteriales archaeon QS_8_69_26]